MLAAGENKEYLPIDGLPAFKKATANLLFGEDNPVLKEVMHLVKVERCEIVV